MAEGVPCHDFLAEPLIHGYIISWLIHTFGNAVGTHSCDFIEVARRVNPQHLDCNVAALMFTPPHIGVPAAI